MFELENEYFFACHSFKDDFFRSSFLKRLDVAQSFILTLVNYLYDNIVNY